ncbi:MAG: hypothetical protein Q9168_005105 [Polycauliona sp. 1 TL-2023]
MHTGIKTKPVIQPETLVNIFAGVSFISCVVQETIALPFEDGPNVHTATALRFPVDIKFNVPLFVKNQNFASIHKALSLRIVNERPNIYGSSPISPGSARRKYYLSSNTSKMAGKMLICLPAPYFLYGDLAMQILSERRYRVISADGYAKDSENSKSMQVGFRDLTIGLDAGGFFF